MTTDRDRLGFHPRQKALRLLAYAIDTGLFWLGHARGYLDDDPELEGRMGRIQGHLEAARGEL